MTSRVFRMVARLVSHPRRTAPGPARVPRAVLGSAGGPAARAAGVTMIAFADRDGVPSRSSWLVASPRPSTAKAAALPPFAVTLPRVRAPGRARRPPPAAARRR